MKRSRNIKLILLGGLSSAMLAGCDRKPAISTQNFYANDTYIPGAGYYHAPFRGWYSLPYNHFDPSTKQYFYGGQWGTKPFESVTNISNPTPQAVTVAENARTDITRGGFGGYGYSSYSSGGYGGGGSWFHSS
jgi:hypothetical protein